MTSSRIQIVDNSEMNRTTIAHKNGQHVDLQVQGMTINFNFPDEKWGWGILFMFYDPETGLLAWQFSNIFTRKMTSIPQTKYLFNFQTERPYYILLSGHKIIYFKVDTIGRVIDCQEFTEKYANLSQAREKVLLILEEQIEKTELRQVGQWHHSIKLSQYLNFWYERRRKVRYRTEIIDIYLETVTFKNAQWTLTLKNVEEEDDKRTFVQLDENYNLQKIWGHGIFKNVEYQNLMAPTKAVIHVEDSEKKQKLEHPMLKGKIEIEAMTINYRLPSGKSGSGTLTLWLYYHCRKLFGWYFFAHDDLPIDKISDTPNPSGWQISEYSNHSANKEKIERFLSKIYLLLLKEEKMVCFMPHFPSEIWCQEFTEEQPGLRDGRQDMCFFLENRLFEVEDQDFGKWYRRIPVEKYLSSQFFQSNEGGMVTEASVKISKATYQNAQWKLELESTMETKPIVHRHATFILDENYNVVEVLTDYET